MGSFNVACSISRISIRCGMKVAFLPLLPNVYDFSGSYMDEPEVRQMAKLRVKHHVGSNTQLIYANCFFNPFCLPIIGEYNDYGSIENIETDANTKAIERYFDMTIEEFINCICGRDSIDLRYTIKKYRFNSDVKITPKGIRELGFEKVEGKRSVYVDPKCPEYHIILKKPTLKENDYNHGNYNVSILHVESKQLKWESENNPHDVHHKLFPKWEKITHRLINYREEDFHKVMLLRKLSGQFMHYDVYKHLVDDIPHDDFSNSKSVADSYVKAKQLEQLGFEKVTNQFMVDSHHDELYRKGDYDVKIGNYGSIILPTSLQEYACFGDKRFVAETRNIWEECTNTKVEDTFPEPAQNEKTATATDTEWKAICDKFEELTGIKPGYIQHKNKRSAYRLTQFKEIWQELTDEVLDISQWEKTYQADKEYDEVKNATKEYLEKLNGPEEFETLTYPSEEIQKTRYDRSTELYAQLNFPDNREPFKAMPEGEEYQVSLSGLRESDNPWGSMGSDKYNFLRFYKEWDYFQELYQQSLADDELKLEFREYKNFYWSFYSVNGFFFPAQNGEQFGNYRALKSLYDKCAEIMQTEIGQQDEDDE